MCVQNTMANMTYKMVTIALELERLSKEYRELYEAVNDHKPVIYIRNDVTGRGIFMSDDELNTDVIINRL